MTSDTYSIGIPICGGSGTAALSVSLWGRVVRESNGAIEVLWLWQKGALGSWLSGAEWLQLTDSHSKDLRRA